MTAGRIVVVGADGLVGLSVVVVTCEVVTLLSGLLSVSGVPPAPGPLITIESTGTVTSGRVDVVAGVVVVVVVCGTVVEVVDVEVVEVVLVVEDVVLGVVVEVVLLVVVGIVVEVVDEVVPGVVVDVVELVVVLGVVVDVVDSSGTVVSTTVVTGGFSSTGGCSRSKSGLLHPIRSKIISAIFPSLLIAITSESGKVIFSFSIFFNTLAGILMVHTGSPFCK